ncbi:MAG: hypothetical protein HY784_17365, partial [Chloroflexi bacterium]|nr:hypothetical protein [Chloroflexota bacterium]
MAEPSAVEARFAPDGKIEVLSFTWQGRRLPATSHGRSWAADDGLHYLLMAPGDRVFELLYQPVRGLWWVVKAPDR